MENAEVRRRLDLILSDREKLSKSANATFKQFDKDHSNTLDFKELRQLVNRLIENLKLPQVDDRTLSRVVRKYDVDLEDTILTPEEFSQMYSDLLVLIREKYYPVKAITANRSMFIGKRKLGVDQQFTDLFTLGKRLGAGCFGEVRLVTDNSNKLMRVCKTVSRDRVDLPLEQIAAEIDCMTRLDHPNVIKIYEVLEDRHNVYIIMEQCAGGELMEIITGKGKRTERKVAVWIKQILEAVAYSHDHNIVHKDLKPENVMFLTKDEDATVKVIDFGVAECFKPAQKFSEAVAGTPLYLAPEEFHSGICGKKVDCWAVGCIMYLLLTGNFPFYASSQSGLRHKVLKGEPKYETECRHISPLAVDLLKKFFMKDPRTRLTAREFLKHEWFQIAPQVNQTLSAEVCGNVQKYAHQSQAKAALLNFMIHQMPCSNTQLHKLEKLFDALDKEDKGFVSTTQFEEALHQAGLPSHEARKVVDTIEDPNEPGVIHYSPFLSACFDYEKLQLDIIWSAFTKLDVNGDGTVSASELAKLLGGENEFLSKKEIDQFIAEVDKNGDNEVQWDEFLAAMQHKKTDECLTATIIN